MKTPVSAWIALAALVVAGNTALILRAPRRAAGGGGPSAPPPEIRLVARPLPDAEADAPAPPGDPVRITTQPGAAVRLEADRRTVRSPFPLAPLASGTAGPDGSLVLVPSMRVSARAVAGKEGFARAEAPVRGTSVALPLDREGVVRGRVVEAEGDHPVAGAAVEARLGAGPAVTATADGDGTFVLRGLGAGHWTVSALTDARPRASTGAVVRTGEEVAVEVRLGKGFSLRGRAVYAGTDRVPSEGTVSLEERTAPLGPDGRFELRGLAGPWRVFRVETGGAVYQAAGQRAERDPATGEQVGEIEVPLPANNPAGLQFRGVVRDEEGRPVAGARVAAGYSVLPGLSQVDRGRAVAGVAEGWTDGEGRYRVPPGNSANQLLVLHPDYAPTHLVLPWRSRNRDFDLVLARGAAVRVRVLDPVGKPAAGAEVYTFLRHPDPYLALTQSGDVQEILRPHPLTDAAGEAVLPRTGPGSWTVAARSADGLLGGRAVLEVGKGDRALAVDLVLRRLPWVGGRVVRRSGAPVAGLEVWVPGEEFLGPGVFARTGVDGRFRIAGLALPAWLGTAGGVPAGLSVPVAGDGPVLLPLDEEAEIVVEGP